jgi:hypothetical protein
MLVHRSWISYTLKMEAIRSSETSVNKISTRRLIPEDDIIHSNRRGNLKSYKLNVDLRSLMAAAVKSTVWHHVISHKFTDISEVCAPSIFREGTDIP